MPERKIGLKEIIISVGIFLVTLIVIINYTQAQNKNIEEQTEYTICHDTKRAAEMVDSTIAYALNCIQVTSIAISNNMTSNTLNNPEYVLEQFMDNTPFRSMEYIKADSKSVMASDAEYYMDGIYGHTGIWIDYVPENADEPILHFYTPLYFNRKIVGVLIGTMGGNTDMATLLTSDYLGQPIAGIVVDEENKIIASTERFEPGTVIEWDNIHVIEENRQTFLDAIQVADDTFFELDGGAGRTIGCVSRVKSTGWKIIQMVPATSLKHIMAKSNALASLSIFIVFVMSISWFSVLIFDTKKISQYNISKVTLERDEQISVLLSMSEIYYSMHLINLVTDTVKEYIGKEATKEIVNMNEGAREMMHQVISTSVVEEDVDDALEFCNLSTIADRMKHKKILSAELNGKHIGWFRASFITIEADKNEMPVKVIFTVQIIEEEKKKVETLVMQSNTDELTGAYNRRAYEDDMLEYSLAPIADNFVYVSMDVNGLKSINDNFGHYAGDELIKGAMECMQECFESYGKIYRIGGDEFVCILFMNSNILHDVKSKFEKTVSNWSGLLVKELSVSCGYVEGIEHPGMNVMEISKIADKKMYEAKASHYRKKGIDRRGQMAVHSAIYDLYSKILKINITNDTYQIMDDTEQKQEKGFTYILSEWFISFGNAGQVHPDDLEEYLHKTDLAFLREYFGSGKKSISIYYRRNVEEDYSHVVMDMIPADDYTQENQSLFLYVKSLEV